MISKIKQKLTIVFTDIVNYTAFAEKFPPYDTVHVLNRYYRISVHSPDKLYFVTIFTDITSKKQAEIALKQSEIQFKTLFNNIPVSNFIWEKKGDDFVFKACNEAAIKFTKGKINSFIGITE